mmetsp:Transcript_47866/g.125314  ORF Transcript_47866/g.125314 Transcript_47866/m.125314 type:complete len:258 (-) Transcript_47866:344-1117(-)
MFSLPIAEICTLRAARALTWAAASDNSLIITMTNGGKIQFDGFWERDECIALLQACGRFLKHPIVVEQSTGAEEEDANTPSQAPPGAPTVPPALPTASEVHSYSERSVRVERVSQGASSDPNGATFTTNAPPAPPTGAAPSPSSAEQGVPLPPAPSATITLPTQTMSTAEDACASSAPTATEQSGVDDGALLPQTAAMQVAELQPPSKLVPIQASIAAPVAELADGAVRPPTSHDDGWVSPRSALWGTPRKRDEQEW